MSLILQGEYIDYRGDPLADFTLMRFLDRFICKNPKQKQSDHGGSLMQRTTKLAADTSKEVLGVYCVLFRGIILSRKYDGNHCVFLQ